jgi:hypothetical protein
MAHYAPAFALIAFVVVVVVDAVDAAVTVLSCPLYLAGARQ